MAETKRVLQDLVKIKENIIQSKEDSVKALKSIINFLEKEDQ